MTAAGQRVRGRQPTGKPRGRRVSLSGPKRRAISFRTTEALYSQIRTVSEASGRSMAQEIELRIEASFAIAETAARLDRIEAKLERALAGSKTR
jgi:hypothetical protein